MAKSTHLEDRASRESEMLRLRVSDLEAQLRHREESEQRLRETEQHMREILTEAQVGAVVYDLDMRYIIWNRYIEERSGLSAHQALGRTSRAFFPNIPQLGS